MPLRFLRQTLIASAMLLSFAPGPVLSEQTSLQASTVTSDLNELNQTFLDALPRTRPHHIGPTATNRDY
jgi:hypothetical protein